MDVHGRSEELSVDSDAPSCTGAVQADAFGRHVRRAIIVGAFLLVASVGGYFYLWAQPGQFLSSSKQIQVVMGLAGMLFLGVGLGLWRRQTWARILSIGLWGASVLFMAVLGLGGFVGFSIAGLDILHDRLTSTALTFAVVIGSVVAALVLLGFLGSCFFLSRGALMELLYFRSDEARRICRGRAG